MLARAVLTRMSAPQVFVSDVVQAQSVYARQTRSVCRSACLASAHLKRTEK